jgi:hypothetical protein
VIVAITFGSDENPARALVRHYSERRRVVVLRS